MIALAILAVLIIGVTAFVGRIIKSERDKDGDRRSRQDYDHRAALGANQPAVQRAIATTRPDPGTPAGEGPGGAQEGTTTGLTVPDAIECVYGWRGWRVESDGMLTATTNHQTWSARQAKAAQCIGSHHHSSHYHDTSQVVPVENCSCGYYITTNTDAIQDGSGKIKAYGRVAAWGKVIEYTNGYRCQYVYPVEIMLVGEINGATEAQLQSMRTKVEQNYGVATRIATKGEIATLKASNVKTSSRPNQAALMSQLAAMQQAQATQSGVWTGQTTTSNPAQIGIWSTPTTNHCPLTTCRGTMINNFIGGQQIQTCSSCGYSAGPFAPLPVPPSKPQPAQITSPAQPTGPNPLGKNYHERLAYAKATDDWIACRRAWNKRKEIMRKMGLDVEGSCPKCVNNLNKNAHCGSCGRGMPEPPPGGWAEDNADDKPQKPRPDHLRCFYCGQYVSAHSSLGNVCARCAGA